ncbi:MAG: PQQ-binding-like beta-propeller repeat protein [Phycisphaerae bacterium]
MAQGRRQPAAHPARRVRRALRPAAALLAAVAAWTAGAAPAPAGDWPRYLGPNQDGTSEETGLLLDWPEGGPPVVWTKRLGASFSPPVVAGDRLVVFHRIANDEVLECVTAAAGGRLWEFRYPTRYTDRYRYNGGPRSSPAIDGDRVYAYGAEGMLTCLDLATGRKVWQRPLNQDLSAPQAFFGVGVPPVVEGDLLLLNPGAPGGAGIVGVDKATGAVRWKATDHGASYSTPVVRTVRGRRLVFVLTAEGLVVLHPATGKVHATMPFRSVYRESVNAASPVVVGDRVFLSAAYRVGSALVEVTPEGLETVWRNKKNMQNHWATSIYAGGVLYGSHGRHGREAVARCIDWDTGLVLWESPRGLGRMTFTLAEGHLLVMGELGHLLLVEATPLGYTEKARAKVLAPPCWGPPVLAGGLLYVRNETVLTCLDMRKPAENGG